MYNKLHAVSLNLELGHAKIAASLNLQNQDLSFKTLALAHMRSRGLSNGVIDDNKLLAKNLRELFDDLRSQTKISLVPANICLPSSCLRFSTHRVELPVKLDETINSSIVQDLLIKYLEYAGSGDNVVIYHQIKLASSGTYFMLYIYSANRRFVAQLERVIASVNQEINYLVPKPIAALNAAVDNKLNTSKSVMLLFNDASTTIALIDSNVIIKMAKINFGGNRLSHDLQHCLKINYAEAERLKLLYGNISMAPVSNDNYSCPTDIKLLHPTNDQQLMISRDVINQIISARFHEITELIANKLNEWGANDYTDDILICGGGSDLAGVSECLNQHFKQSHIATIYPNFNSHIAKFNNPNFTNLYGMQFFKVESFDNKGNWIKSVVNKCRQLIMG